ncbi:hypothetical protein D3C87_418100 [compost metagenome]
MKSLIYFAAMGLMVYTACSKKQSTVAPAEENKTIVPTTNNTTSSDTILNVTYENGSTTSGISGLNPTNATASDAAYTISPGATGNYAVAHKVTLGVPGYYSNDAYRSESDAVTVIPYRFSPGQIRRYEVSILLKDWQQWNSANPPYGDNLFQLKISNEVPVPVRLMAKRNSIVSRRYSSTQENVIADFRPYINQWIHFRIDVKWSDTNDGYMKIYRKLPNDTDYVLAVEQHNFASFNGNVAAGNIGYIKWGVYREAGEDSNGNVLLTDNVLTRIAFHDNIRIIKLD